MQQYFEAVSKRMVEQVRGLSDVLRHPGMKGASTEEIIRVFFRTYLPRRYRVGQGKIVDFVGNESKQIDIIVMDAMNTIPFYVDDINMVVPIECVYAVVEVKTRLVRKTLLEALDNLISIHHLMLPGEYKFLFGNDAVVRSQAPDAYPKGYIFAVNSLASSSIKALAKQYTAFVLEKEIHFPLVSCCAVLDRDHFIDIPGREDNTSEVYLQPDSGKDTLLMFLLNMVSKLDHLGPKKLPPFELYLNLKGTKAIPLGPD